MSTVPETTPPPEAEPAAPAPVERPCTTCGAALAEGQDWCLECGSAQPGRLGGRPGWRAALTVLGVTGLLAVGAGAAAYAALDSEATREATAQAPPAATPTQPPPPTATAETTPTTPPTETTPPTDTVDPPKSDPADVPAPTPAPTPSPTPAPAPPPAPAPTPTPTPDDGGTDTTETEPEPVAIELGKDEMSVYDPYKRGGTQSPGDPEDAVDGKSDTAWSVNVGPDGQVRMGLVVSLDKAQKLGDLELRADTPGFTVETYATKSSEVPPDVLDARWKHLDDARDVGIRETLKLDGEYRHVLLWITSQPADTKVAIPEIELFQQED